MTHAVGVGTRGETVTGEGVDILRSAAVSGTVRPMRMRLDGGRSHSDTRRHLRRCPDCAELRRVADNLDMDVEDFLRLPEAVRRRAMEFTP